MSLPRPTKIATQALVRLSLVLGMALGPTLVPVHAAHGRAAYPPLTVAGILPPPYTRNFNPFTTPNFTLGSMASTMLEPLYIVDNVTGKEHPWLATSYRWSKDLKTLTFTIRHGVRWSDGAPFTARDVYYTLAVLGRKNVTFDKAGLLTGAATAVTMPAPDQVAIHYKTVDVTRFYYLVDFTPIVPEHIWAKVKDPVRWTNPNPVGTGPFTQVKNFSSQGFDVGRNPYYWQKGKPTFDTIRIAGFTSNDAQNLALEAGQVDWGWTTIPRAERVYDARNPTYFHHFYDPRAGLVNLIVPNDTHYPFTLVAFRKALSMAVNRQAVSRNAEYGFNPPADVTALRGPYTSWVDPSIPQTLTQYNPAAAHAMLKQAGFTWQDGHLLDPKGHRVALECMTAVQADWIASCQIIADNFKAIGIDTTVKPLQYGDVQDHLNHATFDIAYWEGGGNVSPYYTYDIECDPNTPYIHAHWTNPKMTALLAEYRQTIDPGRQRALIYKMEHLWVDNLPEIPVDIYPAPADYSTAHYSSYPTAQDDYAYDEPFGYSADTLLILTRLHLTH